MQNSKSKVANKPQQKRSQKSCKSVYEEYAENASTYAQQSEYSEVYSVLASNDSLSGAVWEYNNSKQEWGSW